jgi:spore coat polysaccharide biosynthesis protein SpsF
MLCILQARMSSKRFPGKTLKLLKGKKILELIHEQISRSNFISEIIVATSKHFSDDKIFLFCKKRNIKVFRGSLNNVASRYYQIVKKKRCKYFLRINADSPLSSEKIIDQLCKKSKESKIDIITNVFPRTFPKGQSVEIIRSSLLKKYIGKFDKYDLEHVTSYFYKNFKKFKIKNIKNKFDQSMYNLSIDTKNDFRNMNSVLSLHDINNFDFNKLSQKTKNKFLYEKI